MNSILIKTSFQNQPLNTSNTETTVKSANLQLESNRKIAFSFQFSKQSQAGITLCAHLTYSFQNMKLSVIVVLILLKFSVSTEFLCGHFDSTVESVAFYCSNFTGILPANCSSSFSTANIHDKSKVTHLKVGGCDYNEVGKFVESFSNLQSLDISYSKIDSLDSFDLKHSLLTKVNISHNQLTTIPRQFFSHLPAVTDIDCSHNEIDIVRDLPSKLQTIHLSNNALAHIYYSSFKNLNDLKYLDLSSNSIEAVNFDNIFPTDLKLKTLRLYNNTIEKLYDDVEFLVRTGVSVYFSWNNIKEISILHMPKFDVILNSTDEGFVNTADGRVELYCNEKSFENVEKFHLGNDQFNHSAELINLLTPSLLTLDLSENFIGEISEHFLERFVSLTSLNLRQTHIPEFDFNWLKNLKKLQLLDISSNRMEKVYNASFLGNLTDLRELNAEKNGLQNAQEIIKHLSPKIEELSLSGNHVGEINATTFERLVNLKNLYLSNTSLSFGQSNPFETLKKLQSLDISINNLDYVNLTALPREIKNLNLADNELTTLDGVNRTSFPKLRSLIIERNRIPCNYLTTLEERLKPIRLGNLQNQKGQDCRSEDRRIYEEIENSRAVH